MAFASSLTRLLVPWLIVGSGVAHASVGDDLSGAERAAEAAKAILVDPATCDPDQGADTYAAVRQQIESAWVVADQWRTKKRSGKWAEISGRVAGTLEALKVDATARGVECDQLARLMGATRAEDPVHEIAQVVASADFRAALDSKVLGTRHRSVCADALTAWADDADTAHPPRDPLALLRDLTAVSSCAGSVPQAAEPALRIVTADAAVAAIVEETKVGDGARLMDEAVESWPSESLESRRAMLGRGLGIVSRRAEETVLAKPETYIASAEKAQAWQQIAERLARVEAAYGSPAVAAKLVKTVESRRREIEEAQRAYDALVAHPQLRAEGAWSQGRAADQLNLFTRAFKTMAAGYGLANATLVVRGPDSSSRFYDRGYSINIEADLLACRAGPLTQFPMSKTGGLLTREHFQWVHGFQTIFGYDYGVPKLATVALRNARGERMIFRVFEDTSFAVRHTKDYDMTTLMEIGESHVPPDLVAIWDSFFEALRACP